MILSEGYVELGSDEGAFAIRATFGPLDCSPWDGSTLVTIPADVAELGDVLVLTGAQWGPFAVSTRVLDAPDPAGNEWEDVVEFSLRSRGEVVVTELVNGDPTVALLTEAGNYRVRVSARGRVSESGSDGDEDAMSVPVEHYLIEAWSEDPEPPVIVRETSRYALVVLAGPPAEPEIDGAEAGLAGATAVGRDIDGGPGGRVWSGETGEVTVSRQVPGTRRKLFHYFRLGPTMSRHVPSWGFMSGPDWESIGASTYSSASANHPDQLSGRRGTIRNIVVEEDSPRRRVKRLAWLVQPPGRDCGSRDELTVAVDSTVVLSYTQSKSPEGQVWTTVEVRHSGLPVEWLEDMSAWWAYQLAFMEHHATAASRRPVGDTRNSA